MPAVSRAQVVQVGQYVAIGLFQLAIDWMLFVVLSGTGVAIPAANLASRLTAALVGYALNGRFTFKAGDRPTWGRATFLRYAVLWCTLTATSTLSVMAIDHLQGLHMSWLVKPFVEGVLALVSFLAMKTWVFGRGAGAA